MPWCLGRRRIRTTRGPHVPRSLRRRYLHGRLRLGHLHRLRRRLVDRRPLVSRRRLLNRRPLVNRRRQLNWLRLRQLHRLRRRQVNWRRLVNRLRLRQLNRLRRRQVDWGWQVHRLRRRQVNWRDDGNRQRHRNRHGRRARNDWRGRCGRNRRGWRCCGPRSRNRCVRRWRHHRRLQVIDLRYRGACRNRGGRGGLLGWDKKQVL